MVGRHEADIAGSSDRHGKTIVFAAITEECVRKGERVLILAHRGELLEQAADKIKKSNRSWMLCRKGGADMHRLLVQGYSRICADTNA